MAQPVSISPADIVPVPVFEIFDPPSPRAEGPANRALAELALALSQDTTDIGPKWSPAQTLRFIVLSCGGFWLFVRALYRPNHLRAGARARSARHTAASARRAPPRRREKRPGAAARRNRG